MSGGASAGPTGGSAGGSGCRPRSGERLSPALVAAGVVARTTLEVLDGVGNELGGVALLAVLAFPLARLEATLDVDLVALAQVLGGKLSLLAPAHDAEPLGLFLALALGVLVVAVDRNRELGHGLAAGRVAHLGVTTQVTDDHALVQ